MSSSQSAAEHTSEPFPSFTPDPESPKTRPSTESTGHPRRHEQSTTYTFGERLRSVSNSFQESAPPVGFCIATSQAATNIPSLSAIRRGSFDSEGWSGEGQVREKERRMSLSRRGSSQDGQQQRRRSSAQAESAREQSGQDIIHETVAEEPESLQTQDINNRGGEPIVAGPSSSTNTQMENSNSSGPDQRSDSDKNSTSKVETEFRTTPFDNGYHFPPKHTWKESTAIGLKAAMRFVITPTGFFITIYGLNVVAWGGMLFLLLCNASPAMCYPDCNDINSPRKVWLEIDSQILNALFCVTGFGTIPWRFRDLYYLMQYRIQKKEIGLRRLAGINRGWLRLEGSQDLPVEIGPDEAVAGADVPESALPYPLIKTPNAPLTGTRAPATALWKLDFIIWMMVWNTLFQVVLCGFMWGLNRYDRPSWSTGVFIVLGCGVAIAGGVMSGVESGRVKAIEGVPVSERDVERLRRDREMGITHFNNIKAAGPKEEKKGKGIFRMGKEEDVQVELGAMKEGAGQIIR